MDNKEDDIMRCDRCGAEMVYFQKDSTCGWMCPVCNWGVVTTYMPPIKLDTAKYTIKPAPVENPSLDMIRAASRIFHCNYLQTKKYLQTGTWSSCDLAINTQSIARALSKAGIPYSISPDFPYEI